ncbi:uncharacterized protein Gasu_62020, partial [Galdieria sulphuraria]
MCRVGGRLGQLEMGKSWGKCNFELAMRVSMDKNG